MTNKLYVRNKAQKVLFEKEISGQLSDGNWENEKTDQRLWNCEVIVVNENEEQELGTNFAVRYYADFATEDLDFLWDRMIEYVRPIDPDYDVDQLIIDLNDITNIVYGWEDD